TVRPRRSWRGHRRPASGAGPGGSPSCRRQKSPRARRPSSSSARWSKPSPARKRKPFMSMDDPKTFGRSRLSFAKEAEVDTFVSMLTKFESGQIGPDEWRSFRLVHGAYGQRQEGDLS